MENVRNLHQPNHRILVIDNNTDAAFVLSLLLRAVGYETHYQYSGYEGLKAAEKILPTVIICNIAMPDMNGYETAQLIRQSLWGRRIQLIALTGNSLDESKKRAKEAGFDHYLVKPTSIEILVSLLHTK